MFHFQQHYYYQQLHFQSLVVPKEAKKCGENRGINNMSEKCEVFLIKKTCQIIFFAINFHFFDRFLTHRGFTDAANLA